MLSLLLTAPLEVKTHNMGFYLVYLQELPVFVAPSAAAKLGAYEAKSFGP